MKEAMHTVWSHLHKMHNQTRPQSQDSGRSLWEEGRMEREEEAGAPSSSPSWTLAVHVCSAGAGSQEAQRPVDFSIYVYVIQA